MSSLSVNTARDRPWSQYFCQGTDWLFSNELKQELKG
jgi:hypothetical protein